MAKKKQKYRAKGYLNAIIIADPQPVTGNTALKYHNIKDTITAMANFCEFAAKFPGAKHVNFYYKCLPGEKRGRFKERIYLQ